MKKIKLTKNKFTIVDDEDFELLNQFKWFYNNLGYAVRSKKRKNSRKSDTIYMHRVINKTPFDFFTDHINQNKLDNRKTNLLAVSGIENGRNRGKPKHNTSGFKGVAWDKSRNKWIAYLRVNYKHIYLGRFLDIDDAIKARKQGEGRIWI